MARTRREETGPGLVTYDNLVLPPVVPGEEVKDLCNKVDDFYKSYPHQHRKQKASDLIQGTFYAMRPECRSNTDWMSQAANSARDVLYPLLGTKAGSQNLIRIFNKYAVDKNNRDKVKNQDFITTFTALDRIYKRLSDVTHHGTDPKGFSPKEYEEFSEKDFENLISDFSKILLKTLSLQQIFIHTVIDILVQRKRRTTSLKAELDFILDVNADAHQYFFAKVDEPWLVWLWNNGFIDKIKQKSEDPSRYSYRTPELNYLARMAKKVPDKVVNVMLQVPISNATFNPEVIDQFLRICSELPADQIARISKKILDEKWVPLMGLFNQHGFEFEKMFKTLADAGTYEHILTLAECVLSVRTKKEVKASPGRSITENPFYFNELSYTKVFKYLVDIDDKHLRNALELTTNVFTEVTNVLGKKSSEKPKRTFEIDDGLLLADVDFFILKQQEREGLSPREDIRELAATIKHIVQKLLVRQCNQQKKVWEVYNKHIETLPNSQTAWRLKLYVLSLCPEVFKDELKTALFSIFGSKDYWALMAGAEYKKALKNFFGHLSKADRSDYVKKSLKLFGDKSGGKEIIEDRKNAGSKIFSVVSEHLTNAEQKLIKDAGLQINPDFKPTPMIGKVTGGTVVPRAPITQEEFNALTIDVIVSKLQSDWSPDKLSKQNTFDDFRNPLSGEGVGNLLKSSIPSRLQDFVNQASKFFDRDNLDSHYTYTYLQALENEIKNNRTVAAATSWGSLISLIVAIKDSGMAKPFIKSDRKRERYSSWLANWNAVHSMMAGVIEELLRDVNSKPTLDFKRYRNDLLSVIEYLLRYPDPAPEDEQSKTATMTVTSPGQKPLVTEPYMMAINSVRGRAFESFMFFVHQDGKQFSKEQKVKISRDVKKLYEKVLDAENTKALMFMFGRYIPTFYYGDSNWLIKLLPKLFPASDKLLKLASWEGFISNNLYREIFGETKFQKLYVKGLELRENDDPVRKFFRDPEEGIAIHLALAYAHYKDFGFDHPLFKKFWSQGTEKQHSNFISFLGRKYLSKEDRGQTLKQEPEIKERLEKFWDWVLDNAKHNVSLSKFGYWINHDEPEVLDLAWLTNHLRKTLVKTEGELDWDFGLQKVVVKLAESSPEDTLEVIRLILLEYNVRKEQRHRPIFYETDWAEALKLLYQNPKTKDGTYKLIDDLIREGGSQFWPLKEIIKPN